MGMDVYGKNPLSSEGEYFRNNVWWWRPLWDYCCFVAEDLINQRVAKMGHSNDGAGLTKAKARKLGERLLELVRDGHTKKYEEEYTKMNNDIPDEECHVCGGTGKRKEPPDCGPGDLPCNGCDSVGKVRPFSASYPFSVENVEKFAEFCIASGGFRIL